MAIRSTKLPDPAVEPNAGSFFKNPVVTAEDAHALQASYPAIPVFPQSDGGVKLAAGWMIEYCGWKGCTRGTVGVHPEHALVLVNRGEATGLTLLALARDIALSVFKTFGVSLVIEPRVYGGAREQF